MVARIVRDTVLSNSLVLSRTPANLLTPPLYGDLKNKIHVVKQVLTTCYPTDTGDTKKSNILFRDIAQFGSALRSGHDTNQFISNQPNSHKPFNTATFGRLKKQNTCGQTSFDHMLSHRHGRYKKLNISFRGVAQFGSVLRSGRRGRGFKSRHSDHLKPQ